MPYPNPETRETLAAALDWWRDAGVDCAYREEPRDWLAPAEPEGPVAVAGATIPDPRNGHEPEPKQAPLGGPRADWPTDLAGFADWWTALPGVERIGGIGPLVAPQGGRGAPLLLLLEQPGEAGAILPSGGEGALAGAMLRAMGIEADAVYLAAALPRPVAMPDWATLAEQGLGAVLRHHLALAAPRRVLLLGSNILPLFTNGTAQDPAGLREIQHEGGIVPVLTAPTLRELAGSARLRARLWRDWLDWGEDTG